MFGRNRDRYKINYDREHDVMEIRVLGAGVSVITSEVEPNVFVHKDEHGKPAGFTIVRFSETIGQLEMETPSLPRRVSQRLVAAGT